MDHAYIITYSDCADNIEGGLELDGDISSDLYWMSQERDIWFVKWLMEIC